MSLAGCSRDFHLAIAVLGLPLCLPPLPAAETGLGTKTVLRVRKVDSRPAVDGKLDDPCWKDAATTGPLKSKQKNLSTSHTEAFLVRDADHLYVGVLCGHKGTAPREVKPARPSRELECVELFLDTNNDGNSYYLIRITPDNGGRAACSYHEHTPPWSDRTWQPQFECAVARGAEEWVAELALPLGIFSKNKALASLIGFNLRRSGMPGGENALLVRCACGTQRVGNAGGHPTTR